MSLFTRPGWALPVGNTFRYSYKQKAFLYELLKEGEVTGKKVSPDQVRPYENVERIFMEWIC